MGKPQTYEWITAESLFVAFDSGRCSVISISESEMGSEKVGFKPFSQPIEQVALNFSLQKVAIACQGCIKFYNMGSWYEDSADVQGKAVIR